MKSLNQFESQTIEKLLRDAGYTLGTGKHIANLYGISIDSMGDEIIETEDAVYLINEEGFDEELESYDVDFVQFMGSMKNEADLLGVIIAELTIVFS